MDSPILVKRNNGFKIEYKIESISIDKLMRSKYQSRNIAFEDVEELEGLADSINSIGLLELPLVRPSPENKDGFEIISGHRRIQAASKYLHWKEMQCKIVENVGELDVFRLNLTENIQRSNLSAYEQGTAFLQCQELFGLSDEEIGNQIHKSRQTIANKRQLASAANHYLRYVDASLSRSFLRKFSSSHREILDKLVEPQIIKHAATMIARGGTSKNLQRFVDLFASRNDSPVSQVYSRSLEQFAEKIVSTKSNHEKIEIRNRRFKCPSCYETFEVGRRLIREEGKVLFVINPKNPSISDRKAVYAFPVYKVGDN